MFVIKFNSAFTLTLVIVWGAMISPIITQNAMTSPNITQNATSASAPQAATSPTLIQNSPVPSPSSTTSQTTATPVVTTTKARPSITSDCQLSAQKEFRGLLATELKTNKLVQIIISIEGFSLAMLKHALKDAMVYRPDHWVRSSSREGRSLLMLDENYSYMSLTTLSIGVGLVHANLTTHPRNCVLGLVNDELLEVLRRSFLNDFKLVSAGDASGSLSSDEHICNMHIIPDGSFAIFQHTCCRINQDGDVDCEDVIRNKWITILLALVLVIKFIVMLYSPMIIPESMYRLKYVASQYIYHIPSETPPVGVKVVVTQHPDQYGRENKHKRVRLSQLKNMEVFKTMVGSSRWIPEKVYEVKVQDVRLSVKTRRLLTRTAMPVTLTRLLYNNLFRCRIRKLEALNPCCEANILGKLNPGIKLIKWSQVMRILAGFVFIVILFIPWIIRVTTYLKFDQPIFVEKDEAASSAGLSTFYSGSLVIYFSPLHAFFLLIYVIFVVDSVVYGVISKPMQEKLKFVLRQCLRDMKERSRLMVLGWLTKLILWPFKTCGVLGILFFPIYLVIILIFTLPIVCFYIFPTLNLSVRLIIHLFIFMCPPRVTTKFESLSQKFTGMKEKLHMQEVTGNESFIKRSDYTNKGIAFQLVVIIMCLISFWSLTLLIMEVCSFFVELLVYTFMGVIVNAAVTMKFITVFFLLYLYAKQIFSSVSKDYLVYHKTIHDELLKMKREDINEVAKQEENDQQNTAFRVDGHMATNKPTNPEPVIKVKGHQPLWSTAGMLIFLDKLDNALTPEKFFNETIDLQYGGCPGRVYKQVLQAIVEFSTVIMFLMFVFVVVMAFGDAYQVSTTNQLLATVSGGFVPFLFRYIFKADTSGGNMDTSSIQFLTEFHKAMNAYRQSWTVYDIVPKSVKEWDEAAKEAEKEGPLDGNGNQDNAVKDSESSAVPLLNSTEIELSESKGDDKLEHATSYISMMEDNTDVDIIVDISTPKTRSMLTTGFERGSVSMLGSAYSRGGGGGSARIYRPHDERAVDVV